MNSVSLSSGVRSSLNSLRDIASLMSATQKRLATGRKVNSALDNPAAFFTASALNTRAAGLSTALEQISSARSALDTAKAGIDAIQALIGTAQEVARQAQASADTLAKVTGTVASLTGATSLSFSNGRTITVSDGTTTVTFTKASGNDVQDFLDAVNASAPLAVTASLSSDGRVQLKADGTQNITIGGTATTSDLATVGLAAGTTNFVANSTRQNLAQQFDTLRTQIDALIGDADFNGINLLEGDALSVNLNETGSSTYSIAGVSLSVAGLGITQVSAGSGGSFQTDAEIATALAQMETALGSLELTAFQFSTAVDTLTTRESFTESMIDTLQGGADDLVLADTDADGALLLALQTRQQIAATTLSLSSQADAEALRLFGY